MTVTMLDELMVDAPIDSLILYPGNPRKGNIQAIRESLRENGQFRPLIVQESTRFVLDGNHSLQAAAAEGWKTVKVVFVDVDEKQAKRIVLVANRTADLATYDADLLAEVLKGLDSPVGTGYSQQDYDALLEAIGDSDMPQVEDIIRPPMSIQSGADNDTFDSPGSAPPPEDDAPGGTPEEPDDEMMNNVLGELQGILQLKEDMQFTGSNYYRIPDLKKSMLVDKLPMPVDTWAGQEATPDDGKTHWVWNYGVAAFKGLPTDRAILCFFTYDTYFEGFWDQPAFYTAKMINAGIKMAIVPDYSFYTDMAVATWVWNSFRAQWLGRYFQEAGIKVIPRLQFAIDKKDSASLDFCMMGIPKNPPTLASSVQNMNSPEEFDVQVHNARKCLEALQPAQWLVYGGNPAGRMIEALKPVEAGLVGEVVHVQNYAAKRRGVVFDKKEGLKGMKAKDKARFKRDKTSEPAEAQEPDIAEDTL